MLATLMTLGPAVAEAQDRACSRGLAVRLAQPVDNNTLKVARIAGSDVNEADEWDMAYDAYWCNQTSSTYRVFAAKIEHLDPSGGVIRTRFPDRRGTLTFDPGTNEDEFLMLREVGEAGQFPFPLPASVRITIELTETVAGTGPSSVTVVKSHPLAEHQNPKGGYFPPFRQADIATPNAYWHQGRHADSNFQRWAYDLGIERWDGDSWTQLKQGGVSTNSSDYLSWEQPVYAMSDGEVIGCNRGADDNMVPGTAKGNVPGGNLIWIRTGDETTLYAHLRKNSIPTRICPFSDDKEHKLGNPTLNARGDSAHMVKAGQFLGRSGNSGSSTGGPHLHIHAFRGLPAIWGGSEAGEDADSRPLKFFNASVQARSTSAINPALWGNLDPAAQLPYDSRIQGDPCGQLSNPVDGDEEIRLEIPSSCFPDVYNTLTYRGLRLVHIDVTETASSRSWTTIWRPAKEAAGTEFYYGLDEASAASLISGSGKRVLELESYRVGSTLRFALILVSDPQAPERFVGIGETASEFGQTFASQTAAGRYPAMMSVTEVADIAYITTVFEKAKVGGMVVNAGLPLSGYSQAFNDNAQAGRSLSWVESHVEDDQARLAAVWYEKLTGPYVASGARNLAQIEGDIATQRANGLYTRSLTGHQLGGFTYLALWRKAPTVALQRPTVRGRVASASFSLSDPFATAQCRLDSGSWTPCRSGASYGRLSTGNHKLSVQAISREQIDGPISSASFTVR